MGRFLFASLSLLVVAFSLSGIGADHYCPFGWISHNVSCYKFFNLLMSWDKAERYCMDEQENCQLASIKDVEQSVKLSNYISSERSKFPCDVWIGLRFSKTKSIWEWSDGSNVTYTSWEQNEPNNLFNNEFCAALTARSRYLQWNDKNCGGWNHFVCKFQPRSQAAK